MSIVIIQRFRYVLRYVEKSYFYGNLVSMIIRFPIIPQLYRSSSLDDVSLVVKQGLAMHLLARIVGPSSRFQIEFQFGKRVALSRHEGLGAECLAPCGQDRFGWGPLIHEHLLSADNLFHCFARLGVSAFRTISRAKSRARRMSPRAPRNDHIRAPWTRMCGPCTGPFGPIPSPRMSRPIPPLWRTNLVFAPRL